MMSGLIFTFVCQEKITASATCVLQKRRLLTTLLKLFFLRKSSSPELVILCEWEQVLVV